MTRVTFRKFKDNGDIIAFFPDLDGGQGYCMSYMHIGQHSAAIYPHPDTVPAKKEEYEPLLNELQSIGYDDLKIYRRIYRRSGRGLKS